MNFVKSNIMFLVWLFLYAMVLVFLAFNAIDVFYLFLILELASLLVAFSPVGEWLLRVLGGARAIKTSHDRDYLMLLFNAVYEDAIDYNNNLSRKITLYIEETKDINAYAFGANSISVTRGAIESLDETELKGVIAHEFGHLSNGDTKATLIMTIGNGAFTVIWLFFKLIFKMLLHKDDMAFVLLINAVISFIVATLLAIGSRRSEYMADKFAYDIGYGQGLLDTLYFFKELSIGSKMKLTERLKSSHPNLDNRIARLEEYAVAVAEN